MTLASFTKNLLNHFTCRAIINVDPVGDTAKHSQMDVVEVCREYFDTVVQRTPDSPSFAGAVQWCWQQVETDLFFHLEDDWILKRRVDKDEMLGLFEDKKLVNVVFNKWGWKKNRRKLQRDIDAGNAFLYSDNFLRWATFSLNPGFIRTAYIKQMIDRIDTGKDPVFQFSNEPSKAMTADYPDPLVLWMVDDDNLVINSGGWYRRCKYIQKCGGGGAIWKTKHKPLWHRIQYPLKWWVIRLYWQIKYCR